MAVNIGRLRKYIQATTLIALFIFGVAPVVLASLPNSIFNEKFSIYETGPEGLSVVREALEAETVGGQPKYNITNLVSNLNALNRVEEPGGALVVVGPSAKYDTMEFLSLILFLIRGGSLIVADDFGTGNQILAPLFDFISGFDSSVNELADSMGIEMPTVSDLLGGDSNSTGDSGSGFEIPGSGGSDPSVGGDFQSVILDLFGNVLRRFGFNGSVLMDVGSNAGNPNRPTIVDVDQTGGQYSFTQGVSRVQMEMPTALYLELNVTLDKFNPDTNEIEQVPSIVYQPLTKISFAQLAGSGSSFDTGGELDAFRFLDFLFPLYSTKHSWVETDIEAAATNTATPDPDEWGNAEFTLAFNLPLPIGGNIVFLADPSMFINRWTAQTDQNDNLLLIKNLMNMVTQNNENGVNIPIIFDYGHAAQTVFSPSLYSTALLKLIANMSMFPLLAPIVPFYTFTFGRRLIPKSRRLRPILLTKRRGTRGHSTFEQKITEVKEFGLYGEPIKHMVNLLRREIRKDVRFEGSTVVQPEDIADFFVDNFPGRYSRRELRSQMRTLFRIAANPTKPMPLVVARNYLILLKDLSSLIS